MGSTQGKHPEMVAMVAVGAIAMVLEFLIPYFFTCPLTTSQSRHCFRLTSTCIPLSSSRSFNVSRGNIPPSHLEPLYDSYIPFSFASSEEARKIGRASCR